MTAPTLRLITGLVCLTAPACRKSDGATPPLQFPVMLQAYTPGGITDSVVCNLSVTFPFANSIPSAWSGTAAVRVTRASSRNFAATRADTTLTDAAVEIASRTGDSLRVSIRGPVTLDFDGRFGFIYQPREATGQWRCDDRVPLARAGPGEAAGVWSLFVAFPID
jgi:hypothetical protein